jgi:hypothetical protein
MPNTTNFGWATPADTDLVKDGAAAIRTLGSSIDTSLVDLKGGTTGQVLTKASNTDLDFSFTTPTDQIPLTTKGDLVTFDTADVRLGVGANGTVLTANSATGTGLEWAAPAAAVSSYTLLNAGGTALTGATTITVSSLSGYNDLHIYFDGASTASGSADISIRFNSDSGTNYARAGFYLGLDATLTANGNSSYSGVSFNMGKAAGSAATVFGSMSVQGANSAGIKPIQSIGAGTATGGEVWVMNGHYKGTSVISSISIISNSGNFDAGTIYVYGAN